eukprot:TRINITY_DN593_c0_g1_i2.p2 TRINITY_DN593_c0_g1~~TRINITY_DN593_c0_g1_i2.p2  ORF type:complete len:129 (+),score=31.12 TRINITY_DN593_c0_g1_i2:533-919(+)
MILALCHDCDDGVFGKINREIGTRRGQASAHDVCPLKHVLDGTPVNSYVRKHLWIFVQEPQVGEVGSVPLLSEQNLATHREQVDAVSYTHLRAHETPEHLVCRLLLEKKKKKKKPTTIQLDQSTNIYR